jgi:hypothetical protein
MKKLAPACAGLMIIACFLFFIASCKKSGSSSPDVSSFTWMYNNSKVSAKSHQVLALIAGAPYTILASADSNLAVPLLAIQLNNLKARDHAITGSQDMGTEKLRYVERPGDTVFAYSGTVHITSLVSNTLSGSFSILVHDESGNSRPFTGSFNRTPVIF